MFILVANYLLNFLCRVFEDMVVGWNSRIPYRVVSPLYLTTLVMTPAKADETCNDGPGENGG